MTERESKRTPPYPPDGAEAPRGLGFLALSRAHNDRLSWGIVGRRRCVSDAATPMRNLADAAGVSGAVCGRPRDNLLCYGQSGASLRNPSASGGPRAARVAAAVAAFLRGKVACGAPHCAPGAPRAGRKGRFRGNTAGCSSPTGTRHAAEAGRTGAVVLAVLVAVADDAPADDGGSAPAATNPRQIDAEAVAGAPAPVDAPGAAPTAALDVQAAEDCAGGSVAPAPATVACPEAVSAPDRPRTCLTGDVVDLDAQDCAAVDAEYHATLDAPPDAGEKNPGIAAELG